METFEWFDPRIGTPMVSLAEYGLTFNRAAVELLSRPRRVVLGFSRTQKAIGVKPVDDSTGELGTRSLDFAKRERDGYVRLSSKDFVRFVMRYCPDVNPRRTMRYLATWDDNRALLLIDLTRPLNSDAADEGAANAEK